MKRIWRNEARLAKLRAPLWLCAALLCSCAQTYIEGGHSAGVTRDGGVSAREMLARIKEFVERDQLDRQSVERELGVRLVPSADPSSGSPRAGFYVAAAARDPIVTECPPLPTGVVQRFMFREDYRLADLFIPFRTGFAFTETMVAEALGPPWLPHPAYRGRWIEYQFEGKENRYEVSFHMNNPCHELSIRMRSKKEVRIIVPANGAPGRRAP